jgi:two-component sensor histidine kinase
MVSAQAQATNAEHEDEYEVLRSFFEWTRTQSGAPLDQNGQSAGNLYPSRDAMSPQLSISAKERTIMTPISSKKRPIATRIFRTIVYVVVIAVLVFVGWQAYRDEVTKEAISGWWSSSAAWVSFLQHQFPVGAKAGAATGPRSLDPAAPVVAPSAEATESNKLSHEIQQQLQTIASDLAVVQRTVEQLANKQDQMAEEITSLRVAEQNASKTASSIAQTLIRIQRSNAQNVVRSERGQQSSSAPSVVSQSVGTNTPVANTPPAQ